MGHLSEDAFPLKVTWIEENLKNFTPNKEAVDLIILPYYNSLFEVRKKEELYQDLNSFIEKTDEQATIAILTSSVLAADYCAQYTGSAHLKLWIAIKLDQPIQKAGALEIEHAALLIFTRYSQSLAHTKTRIEYSYCPACDKTTKDYGGKKHLYHEYGTLMSDVWRDITIRFDQKPTAVIDRLKDLFGLKQYKYLNVLDERTNYKAQSKLIEFRTYSDIVSKDIQSQLLNGDCITELKKIPDNSLDFCFADPPYNIKKKYENWNDGIDIQEYFNWCDEWLTELARILKPGRTLAVLNIPQWCIRHFKHLNNILDYQDWIVWEGLSMPVRMIMPAHYSILCFSKGIPRPLPGLIRENNSDLELRTLNRLSEGFCIRSSCINRRHKLKIKDREIAGNLWWDVHRLKHNSRRLDHPCQLPPLFMHRLISLFTNEGESVIDPFNGVGTTTLTAHQMNRKYIGIELSEYYHKITDARHMEIIQGLDPFRKNNDSSPKAKNSPVARLKKQKYDVSKKVLQLEVRRIANQLKRVPTREELSNLSNYPIEYYDEYFINWGEVCAAVRAGGMTETRNKDSESDTNVKQSKTSQLEFFE